MMVGVAAQLVNEDTSREYRLVCDDLRLAKAQIGNVELLKEQILSLEAKAVTYDIIYHSIVIMT